MQSSWCFQSPDPTKAVLGSDEPPMNVSTVKSGQMGGRRASSGSGGKGVSCHLVNGSVRGQFVCCMFPRDLGGHDTQMAKAMENHATT